MSSQGAPLLAQMISPSFQLMMQQSPPITAPSRFRSSYCLTWMNSWNSVYGPCSGCIHIHAAIVVEYLHLWATHGLHVETKTPFTIRGSLVNPKVRPRIPSSQPSIKVGSVNSINGQVIYSPSRTQRAMLRLPRLRRTGHFVASALRVFCDRLQVFGFGYRIGTCLC